MGPYAAVQRFVHGLRETTAPEARVVISWDRVARPAQTALPYAASRTFAVGDVIEPPKFGRGKVVASVMKRIDVEFVDGTHTLVRRRNSGTTWRYRSQSRARL